MILFSVSNQTKDSSGFSSIQLVDHVKLMQRAFQNAKSSILNEVQSRVDKTH